ncbi:hypothetical protein GGI10_005948, partial [Coemansia sp. RSA 2530]
MYLVTTMAIGAMALPVDKAHTDSVPSQLASAASVRLGVNIVFPTAPEPSAAN